MTSRLNTTPLSKCLSKVIDYRGRTPKKLGYDWSTSGYRAISANNVKFSGLIKTDSIYYANEELYKKWMKDEVKRGDLLLTSEAPSGQVMLWDSDEKIILSQRLFALRTNNIVYNKYLKFYLQSPIGQKEIFKNNSGSTVFGISAKTFQNISIHHPDYSEQIKIGDLLYSIDKKIELNNCISGELDAMAKTLYDYWFVQFDFPNVNGKPYKTFGGKMVYNSTLKREIPEGWEVNTVADWIANDKNGDWGKEDSEGNYSLRVDCIRGTDINGINGIDSLEPPTRFILEKNKSKLLNPYDLIIEISGGSPIQSTGRIAFITEASMERFANPIICSNFCKAISLKDNTYFYNFAYQWTSIYQQGILFGWEGKTSGIKNLLFDAFTNKYHVPKPPSTLANSFFETASKIEKQKQILLKQNSELCKLRDWLLPMLMNGQVTVK